MLPNISSYNKNQKKKKRKKTNTGIRHGSVKDMKNT